MPLYLFFGTTMKIMCLVSNFISDIARWLAAVPNVTSSKSEFLKFCLKVLKNVLIYDQNLS